jgi:hypothetical protein
LYFTIFHLTVVRFLWNDFRYGSIVSAKAIVAKDRPAECQGYGFVMFENAEDAAVAVVELSKKPDMVVQFAKISPRPRVPGTRLEDPTNLYFSNLPLNYDEARLNVSLSGVRLPCGISHVRVYAKCDLSLTFHMPLWC